MTVAVAEYTGFEEACNYFNEELFEGKLHPCLITLQRRRCARGYFAPERFENRNTGATSDEIALNPLCLETPDPGTED